MRSKLKEQPQCIEMALNQCAKCCWPARAVLFIKTCPERGKLADRRNISLSRCNVERGDALGMKGLHDMPVYS